MRDPNFYDYGDEDWSGYATRKAIEAFALSLLRNIDDVTKSQCQRVFLDDALYYKLTGGPTKIYGLTIRSVLFSACFQEILVAGHTYKRSELR